MTYFEGWRIYLFDGTGDTEITSSVQGFSTQETVRIGSLSSFDAVITLDNDSGDFTPAEGGGTGTYKNTNWLTKGIKIKADVDTVTNPLTLFTGIVADVDFRDNGINSTMTIMAQDWLSLCNGLPGDYTESSLGNPALWYLIQTALELPTNPVVFPKLDQPTYDAKPFIFNVTQNGEANLEFAAASNIKPIDYIAQTFLRAAPGIILPISIGVDNPNTDILYFAYAVDRNMIPAVYDLDPAPIKFSENPTGDKLAFQQLEAGFNYRELTSVSSITSGYTGVTPQTVSNTGTGQTYGTRARSSSGTGNATDADALDAALFWTQRQGTTRYQPRRLTTSIEAMEAQSGFDSASAAQLWKLLDADYLWFPVVVEYTPANGTQVETTTIITGRTVQAVPGRTTVTLELLPGVDYYSFILNDDYFGVLDQNRLG